ncbi:MAG: hypothetical protein ACK5XN_19760, partial [Bacteroidota bacterium]
MIHAHLFIGVRGKTNVLHLCYKEAKIFSKDLNLQAFENPYDMKKCFLSITFLKLIAVLIQGCENNDDNKVPDDLANKNFIWKGLNLYYLWQSDVTNLADDRFENQTQLNSFLYGFPNPESLFQQLLNRPRSLFPNPG